MASHCLNMKAAFGFNKDLMGGVHSLFDETREAILFPSSHTLVYHDCRNGSQRFLQGHSNMISAVCVSNDKRWIVSADFGGKDTMIIVWESKTLLPVRTIVDQVPGGVIRMDLSDDGALLAVLSGATPNATKVMTQSLFLFEWSNPDERPVVSVEIPPQLGFQRDVRFNPCDYREIVTNSAYRTVFWLWEERIVEKDLINVLNYHSPDIHVGEFKALPSVFTVSCFLPGTTAALTGTVAGEVILYDINGRAFSDGLSGAASGRRVPIKLLTLHASSGNVQAITANDEIMEKDETVIAESYTASGEFGTTPFLVPGQPFFQALVSNNKMNQRAAFYKYLTAAQQAAGQMTTSPTAAFAQAITFICARSDGFIITGGLDGCVRMFDFRLRLLSWYENLACGPITSVSIAMPQYSSNKDGFQGGDADISISAVALLPGATPREYASKSEALHAKFGSVVLRDFIVGTSRGSIVLVPAALFEFVEPSKRRGTLLYQGIPHATSCVYTPRDTRDLPIRLNYNLKTQASLPLSWVATMRGDMLLFDFTSNKILRSISLAGHIAATESGTKRLSGTLAQRHAEGYEQACYLVPEHPLAPLKTQSYAHITALSLFCPADASRPVLLAGTSVGSCLLMDPFTLQVLSTFRHLSRTKTIPLSCPFLKRKSISIPAQITHVRFSKEGDIIAVLDETSFLTLLTKSISDEPAKDLTTGRITTANDATEKAFNYSAYSDIFLTSLVTPLQAPPVFITDAEDAKQSEQNRENETRTASGVRLQPAALLARASQKKRADASTTGQWTSLGRLVITNNAILRAVIYCDFLPTKLIENGRDPLVLLSKDRFFTIIDVDKTLVSHDLIVVHCRFRAEQSATPTAVCFLPRPPYYVSTLTEEERNVEVDKLNSEQNVLSRSLKEALFSLQSEDSGALCAKYRPDLQPVEQRNLLLVANSHYKFRLREIEALPGALELSNRTVFPASLLTTAPQLCAYFTGGYTPQGQLPNAAILQGPQYCVNPSLAGPYPLRRTILAPTYGLPINILRHISAYMSDSRHDLSSCTPILQTTSTEERYRYRTRYETLNSAGAIRHIAQYIAFATPRKVIGLMRTPLDGASHRYMGLIGHAGEILSLDICFCFSPGLDAGNTFLVSSGSADFTLFLWGVDYPTFDLMIDSTVTVSSTGQQAGPITGPTATDFASFDPFTAQLEGGPTGQFYAEIQDYFSYAQINDSEEKGITPKEDARAPVSMLDEILRALGVFISNSAMVDAKGEIIEEAIRASRLRFFLSRLRAALKEGKPPILVEATAFGYNPLEDSNQETRVMSEMSLYEQSESSLWELVGADDVTLSLQEFVRILVNHRPVLPYKMEDIVRAFTVFGADEAVGVLDKATLINALVNNGENFSGGELMDALSILAGGSSSSDTLMGAGGLLPDQVSVVDFANTILGFETDQQSEGRLIEQEVEETE